MTYTEYKNKLEINVEEAKNHIDTELYDFTTTNGDATFVLPTGNAGAVKPNRRGFIVSYLKVSDGEVVAKTILRKVRGVQE